jgi:hypothetical protein
MSATLLREGFLEAIRLYAVTLALIQIDPTEMGPAARLGKVDQKFQ